MQTPWFLEYLGLSLDADAAKIRQTYAKRLKQIDQANDPDGFMRLREAYGLAQAWHGRSTRETVAATPAPPEPVPEPMPRQADARGDDALPFLEAPGASASRAMQELASRLQEGMPPEPSLQQALLALREGHLQAPQEFELLLAEALASGRLPQRYALFHEATRQFPWNDVTHLRQLAGRGHWIGTVIDEETLWLSQPTQQRDTAELLVRNCASISADMDASTYPTHLLGRWPQMHALLERYPRYLALRCENATLKAWQRAFNLAVEKDRQQLASRTRSPAAFQARRARKPMPWRILAGGVAAMAFIILLYALAIRPSTPVPRAVMVARQLQPCLKIDAEIHDPRWQLPESQRDRDDLVRRTRECLQLGDWPGWRDQDAPLGALGIADWQLLLAQSKR